MNTLHLSIWRIYRTRLWVPWIWVEEEIKSTSVTIQLCWLIFRNSHLKWDKFPFWKALEKTVDYKRSANTHAAVSPELKPPSHTPPTRTTRDEINIKGGAHELFKGQQTKTDKDPLKWPKSHSRNPHPIPQLQVFPPHRSHHFKYSLHWKLHLLYHFLGLRHRPLLYYVHSEFIYT